MIMYKTFIFDDVPMYKTLNHIWATALLIMNGIFKMFNTQEIGKGYTLVQILSYSFRVGLSGYQLKPTVMHCLWSKYTYCQQLECSNSSLSFWPYYMSSAHKITTPCTCVNNTSCNQPKGVQEQEIQAPRGTEWQCGVGTLELLAVW